MTDYVIRDCEGYSDTTARGCHIVRGHESLPLLVVGKDTTLRAYLNSCPHTGVRLEWRDHDFFDSDGRYLQCATHGALFEPLTGRCVAGPCVGKHLVTVKIRSDGETLVISEIEDIPSPGRR
jgi:nitrite reductase/ring-hydroxylating ferredoxin subunit